MAVRTTRQNEIVEESLVLIAEHGMEGLTYRHLSERFGISIPAFYRHYSSKADVLLGIIDYLKEVSLEVFQSAGASGTDALERLRLVLMGYARQFSANSGLEAALFPDEIGAGRRELQESVLEHMSENQRRLTALLADGMAAGLVRADISADRWAFVIMAALRLEVTQWRLDGRKTDLVAKIATLWRDLEQMIGVPEATNQEV